MEKFEMKFEEASAIGNMIGADKFTKESLSDVPKVVEIHVDFKEGYSTSPYRFVFDPVHERCFVYEGRGGILDKFMGMAELQKNGKGIVVSTYWFEKKLTKTFNDDNIEFIKGVYYDAETPEAYKKAEESNEEELKEENLPFNG